MRPYLLFAIVLFAFNLRPGLVTIGTVLPQMQHDLGLAGPAAGLLTALPVFGLGLCCAVADAIGRRIGWGRGVILAALAIGLGIALRSFSAPWGLYPGALLLGAGAGLGAVLVPPLLKSLPSRRIGWLMGTYTLMLTFGSMISVAATPPIAALNGGDWRVALGAWALPAFACALVWLPLWAVDVPPHPHALPGGLWTNPVAWSVTTFMCLQSMIFYSLSAWLPTLLQARGLGTTESALALSIFFLPQTVTSLFGPMLVARARRQDLLAAGGMCGSGLALAGVLFGPPGSVYVWCAVLGTTLGGVFGAAVLFLVVRTHHPQASARLSAMAQSVGYTLAAVGPLVLGALRTAADPNLASAAWLLLLVAAGVVAGALAGRPRFVDAA